MRELTRYAIRVCDKDGSFWGYAAPLGECGFEISAQPSYMCGVWHRMLVPSRIRRMFLLLQSDGFEADFVQVRVYLPGVDPLILIAAIISLVSFVLRVLPPPG